MQLEFTPTHRRAYVATKPFPSAVPHALTRVTSRPTTAVRGCGWSALTDAFQCNTLALAPGQPRVLPPSTEPTLRSFTVRLQPPTSLPDGYFFFGGYLLQHRLSDSGDDWSAPTMRIDQPSWVVDGLLPGRAYEVRAIAVLTTTAKKLLRSVPSDPTVHRTLTTEWALLRGSRLSELCPDDCEPDYLYNHELGDLPSVIQFMTTPVVSNATFEKSMLTSYCIYREPVAYHSCM
eukprot:2213154-Prymnesium_polylepis.1